MQTRTTRAQSARAPEGEGGVTRGAPFTGLRDISNSGERGFAPGYRSGRGGKGELPNSAMVSMEGAENARGRVRASLAGGGSMSMHTRRPSTTGSAALGGGSLSFHGGAARRDKSTEERAQEFRERRSRITVAVRVRPLSYKEVSEDAFECVKVANNSIYVSDFCDKMDYLRTSRLKTRQYTYDAAFGPEASGPEGQEAVYEAACLPLVDGVLSGRNGCVFCYGATGSGKTYTMTGGVEAPGVMVLAMRDLFGRLEGAFGEGAMALGASADPDSPVHDPRAVSVRLSYLEVYNEKIRDLLRPEAATTRSLSLQEDQRGGQGVIVAGLSKHIVSSSEEVMGMLQAGNLNRTTESTRCNETSSRSHAILQVYVDMPHVAENGGEVFEEGARCFAKLSMIDLAGSERVLATEDKARARANEGANINKSLLALSSCINSLVDGKKHIPFRNSKLTQLLKDSLGGNCLTAMIAAASPGSTTIAESSNTFHYAFKAKEIRVRSKVNIGSGDEPENPFLKDSFQEELQRRMEKRDEAEAAKIAAQRPTRQLRRPATAGANGRDGGLAASASGAGFRGNAGQIGFGAPSGRVTNWKREAERLAAENKELSLRLAAVEKQAERFQAAVAREKEKEGKVLTRAQQKLAHRPSLHAMHPVEEAALEDEILDDVEMMESEGEIDEMGGEGLRGHQSKRKRTGREEELVAEVHAEKMRAAELERDRAAKEEELQRMTDELGQMRATLALVAREKDEAVKMVTEATIALRRQQQQVQDPLHV